MSIHTNHTEIPHIEIEFQQTETFQSHYYRNNRASGQKNIRCFPTCGIVHVQKHFCGRPVVAVIRMSISNKEANENLRLHDLFIVARFAESHSSPEIQNMYLTRDDHLNILRNQNYFIGKITNVQHEPTAEMIRAGCIVKFNTECRGWSYAWIGSRFKTGSSHLFLVEVYMPIQDEEYSYEKIGTSGSPSFKIASLRRKGGQQFQDEINSVNPTFSYFPGPVEESSAQSMRRLSILASAAASMDNNAEVALGQKRNNPFMLGEPRITLSRVNLLSSSVAAAAATTSHQGMRTGLGTMVLTANYSAAVPSLEDEHLLTDLPTPSSDSVTIPPYIGGEEEESLGEDDFNDDVDVPSELVAAINDEKDDEIISS